VASNNPLNQTFETINQASGGVVGGVASGVVDAVKSATVDVVEGAAQGASNTPISALKGLLGDMSEPKASNGDPGAENLTAASTGNQSKADDFSDDPVLQARKQEIQQRDAEKLRQHRMVIDQFVQAHEEIKREEQEKDAAETQEEQEKTQIKQLEKQKKQDMAVQQAQMQSGGTGEVRRSGF
jgi:hypothetical protein